MHRTATRNLWLAVYRQSKKSRGIGYVQYAQAEEASAARAAMDGNIFQGRLLHVLPARRAPAPPEAPHKVSQTSSAKQSSAKQFSAKQGSGVLSKIMLFLLNTALT